MTTNLLLQKAAGAIRRKLDALAGRMFFDLNTTLSDMGIRPFELHLELTNVCNARCVFCPYQFQQRKGEFMSDEVFFKTVQEFVAMGGGSVGLTPIVGEPLADPSFLDRVRHLRGQPAIDRIFVTTNGILLDKVGIAELLKSGVTAIGISVPSFHREDYRALYGVDAYDRVKENVTRLVDENAKMGRPAHICIGFRTGRALRDVMRDPDFKPILAHDPEIDFTWAFTSAGGLIKRESLPGAMRLRVVRIETKCEPCVSLYNGPMVLADGRVLACACVAAMDAIPDLQIGNIRTERLVDIWRGEKMQLLRSQFADRDSLNPTCKACDMYRNLDLYRTREGRLRADLNRRRHGGESVRRADRGRGMFSGG